MRLRTAAAVVPLVLMSLVLAAPARADETPPPTPVECAILDSSPKTITLGVTSKNVTFGVTTDCDGTYPVDWYLNSELLPYSANVSWLALCNWYPGPVGLPQQYSCTGKGTVPLNMLPTENCYWCGNRMAGTHKLGISAFADVDGDGFARGNEIVTRKGSSFELRRRTTFDGSFSASARKRQKGQKVSFTGQLERANWDTGVYDDSGDAVVLQFRADGAKKYRDVVTVRPRGTAARTSVTVTRSGSWRSRFAGDGVSSATVSNARHVTVTPKHRGHHR